MKSVAALEGGQFPIDQAIFRSLSLAVSDVRLYVRTRDFMAARTTEEWRRRFLLSATDPVSDRCMTACRDTRWKIRMPNRHSKRCLIQKSPKQVCRIDSSADARGLRPVPAAA